MCGLNLTSVPNAIEGMNQKIVHRGLPGRSGIYKGRGFWMGHVRLPIVGLGTGYDQPYLEDRRALAFVGEIFNHKRLDPESACDTQVLARLWPGLGSTALLAFDGFWAFAHHDERESGVVEVVTDDLAKKPLYIHEPTLSVSSEIKALVPLDDEREPDELYFSSVAKWGYHIGDRTPFLRIHKLPPCSITRIDYGRWTRETRLWGELRPLAGVNLRAEIERAVEDRLEADVPISLLVSGGLDSSIIYKLTERRTHDFTIYHVDNGEEEFLDMLDVPGDVRVVKLTSDPADVGRALYYNESPVDLGSMLPQYAMGSKIKANGEAPVVLTGDGADELFGGYRRMVEYDAQRSDVFEELVYYHLPRLDKLSMAHTLELRSPFLSRRVIQGALALPYPERIEKRHLKKLFEDLVPRAILERKKHPLKSAQVLEGGMKWRLKLIKKFREETMNEYR